MDNTIKIIIFSTLISLNIVIWYEIFGLPFLLLLGIAITGIVLFLWKK